MIPAKTHSKRYLGLTFKRFKKDFSVKKTFAGSLAFVFLFSVVTTPIAEANFWKERRESISGRKQSDQTLYASRPIPSTPAENASLLPTVQRVHKWEIAVGPDQNQPSSTASSSLPEWLSTLPHSCGVVRSVRPGRNPQKPWIVLIQDAHEMEIAQTHIAQIMEHIRSRSDNQGPMLIGMEGASGAFDTETFRRFTDNERRKSVSEFLLKNNLVSGAEYFALTSPRSPVLWGTEDTGLYDANVSAYRECLPHKQTVSSVQTRREIRLDQLRDKILTPELARFDRLRASFSKGETGPLAYVTSLAEWRAPAEPRYPNLARFVSVVTLERSLDFKKVETERASLIEGLTGNLSDKKLEELLRYCLEHRMGRMSFGQYHGRLRDFVSQAGLRLEDYPSFREYVRYITLSEGIDQNALFEELGAWQTDIQEGLHPTGIQNEFLALSENILLQAKLWDHNLTPREWGLLEMRGTATNNGGKTLEGFSKDAGLPTEGLSIEGRQAKPFEDFYRHATKRNTVLVDNFARKLDETSAATEPHPAPAVFIAGGFHTSTLQTLLSRRGYPTVILTPKVDATSGDAAHYLDIFSGTRTPLEKLLLGDRLTLNPPPALSVHLPPGFKYLREVVNKTFASLYIGFSGMGEQDVDPIRKQMEREFGYTIDIKPLEMTPDLALYSVRFNGEITFELSLFRKSDRTQDRWAQAKEAVKNSQKAFMTGETADFNILISRKGTGILRFLYQMVKNRVRALVTLVSIPVLVTAAAQLGSILTERGLSVLDLWTPIYQLFSQGTGYFLRHLLAVPPIFSGAWWPYPNYVFNIASILTAGLVIVSVVLARRWAARRGAVSGARPWKQFFRQWIVTPALAVVILFTVKTAGNTAFDALWPPVQNGENRIRLINVDESKRSLIETTIVNLPEKSVNNVQSMMFDTIATAYGVYFPYARHIDVDLQYPTFPSTIAHEIGHNDQDEMDPKVWSEWVMLHIQGQGKRFNVSLYSRTNPSEDYAETYRVFVARLWHLLDRADHSPTLREKALFVSQRFLDTSNNVTTVRIYRPDGLYDTIPVTLENGRLSYDELRRAYLEAVDRWPVELFSLEKHPRFEKDGGVDSYGVDVGRRTPLTARSLGLSPESLKGLKEFDELFGKTVRLYISPSHLNDREVAALLDQLTEKFLPIKDAAIFLNTFIDVLDDDIYVNGQKLDVISLYDSGMQDKLSQALSSVEGSTTQRIWMEALKTRDGIRQQVDLDISLFRQKYAQKLSEDSVFKRRLDQMEKTIGSLVDDMEEFCIPSVTFGSSDLLTWKNVIRDFHEQVRQSLETLLHPIYIPGLLSDPAKNFQSAEESLSTKDKILFRGCEVLAALNKVMTGLMGLVVGWGFGWIPLMALLRGIQKKSSRFFSVTLDKTPRTARLLRFMAKIVRMIPGVRSFLLFPVRLRNSLRLSWAQIAGTILVGATLLGFFYPNIPLIEVLLFPTLRPFLLFGGIGFLLWGWGKRSLSRPSRIPSPVPGETNIVRVGIDIGGTNVRIGFYSTNGNNPSDDPVIFSLSTKLPRSRRGVTDIKDVIRRARRMISKSVPLMERAGWTVERSVGVGAPGAYLEDGSVYPGSARNIPSLEQVKLHELLKSSLGEDWAVNETSINNDGVLQGQVAAHYYLRANPDMKSGKIAAFVPGTGFGAGCYDVKNGKVTAMPGPQQLFDVIVRKASPGEDIIVSDDGRLVVRKATGGEELMIENLTTGKALELLGSAALGQPVSGNELSALAMEALARKTSVPEHPIHAPPVRGETRADFPPQQKQLTLPDWAADFIKDKLDTVFETPEDKMTLAVELSRLNVENGTGGPFGSAVFDLKTNKLISVGVNRVVPENSSVAHGEVMALIMAQERLGTFDLGGAGMECELVTSAQPCVMCYGATLWSGVKKVTMGARGEDVEKIVGFDEGPLHPNWREEMKNRGIDVQRDVERTAAVRVLRDYVRQGGPVYNARTETQATQTGSISHPIHAPPVRGETRADFPPQQKQLTLPDWAADFIKDKLDTVFETPEDKMTLAVELSRLNVENGTGGPFGSAVFDLKTNKLISVGVNRVVPENSSVAHGEVMALIMAQERLGTFDLGGAGMECELVTSAQPCVMCYGATLWSGVKKVTMGARGEDVEKIVGFDEGPLHPNWQDEMKSRGIDVQRDVERQAAVQVLRDYIRRGGPVYNARTQDDEAAKAVQVFRQAGEALAQLMIGLHTGSYRKGVVDHRPDTRGTETFLVGGWLLKGAGREISLPVARKVLDDAGYSRLKIVVLDEIPSLASLSDRLGIAGAALLAPNAPSASKPITRLGKGRAPPSFFNRVKSVASRLISLSGNVPILQSIKDRIGSILKPSDKGKKITLGKIILVAILSSVIYDGSYVLLEQYSHQFEDINALTILFARGTISGLAALVFTSFSMIVKKHNPFKDIAQLGWKKGIRPLLILNVFDFALLIPLSYLAFKLTTAQAISLIWLAAPLGVASVSAIILKIPFFQRYLGKPEAPRKDLVTILSYVVIVAGVAMVALNSGVNIGGSQAMIGNLMVMTVVLLTSVEALYTKKISGKIDALPMTSLSYLMGLPILVLLSFTTFLGPIQWSALMGLWALPGLWIVGIGMVAGLVLYLKALKHGSPFLMILIESGVGPISAALFTALLMSRLPLISEIAAFLLIMTGVGAISLKETKKAGEMMAESEARKMGDDSFLYEDEEEPVTPESPEEAPEKPILPTDFINKKSLEQLRSMILDRLKTQPAGRPLLVSVDGDSDVGKTTTSQLLNLPVRQKLIHLDDFYSLIDIGPEYLDYMEQFGGSNFPDTAMEFWDADAARREIQADISSGQYDVIIIEGLNALRTEIKDLKFDIRAHVTADMETRKIIHFRRYNMNPSGNIDRYLSDHIQQSGGEYDITIDNSLSPATRLAEKISQMDVASSGSTVRRIEGERAPPIDFTLYTPSFMNEMYQKIKDDIDRKLQSIISIPSSQRTFDNTIRAIEDAQSDVVTFYYPVMLVSSVSPDEETRETAKNILTEMGQIFIDIYTREDLYGAVKDYAARGRVLRTVYSILLRATDVIPGLEKPITRFFSSFTLVDEDRRLYRNILGGFLGSGMKLKPAKRQRYKEIQNRLIELSNEFETNLNEHKDQLEVTRDQLAGLPDSFIDGLSKTDDGRYILTLDYPTYNPAMDMIHNAEVRRQLHFKFNNRAADKNVSLLEEALRLRKELAGLFKVKTYAKYSLAGKMAQKPSRVWRLLNRLKKGFTDKAREEKEELLALKRQDIPGATRLEPWDINYYAYRMKKARYEVDPEEIRQYFPMDLVIDETLLIYQELLGVRFNAMNVKTWHDDIKVFEIVSPDSGQTIGYFYLDLFPREGKYGHAAMFPVTQGRELPDGKYQYPVGAIVANFTKPTGDRPSLLDHDEVETFFHEFGHLMHQTLTKARYTTFAGTSVSGDFVEVPSMLMQDFVWNEQILNRLSGHYRDRSKKLPQELLDKMLATKNFRLATSTLRTVAFSTFDMLCHTAVPKDTTETYRRVMESMGFDVVPGTHWQAGFGHIMGGYEAGYYGYIWAEVYAKDIFSRFEEAGLLNPALGAALREKILSRGSTEDEMDMLEDFLGRKPSEMAYFSGLGLPLRRSILERLRSSVLQVWKKLSTRRHQRPEAPPRSPGESIRENAIQGPRTLRTEIPARAPPREALPFIDFSGYTPESIQSIYDREKARWFQRIEQIVSIPKKERTFLNTVRAIEDAEADLVEALRPSFFLSDVSPREDIRNLIDDLENDLDKAFVEISMREDLYRAVKEYASISRLPRIVFGLLYRLTKWIPILPGVISTGLLRSTLIGEDKLLLEDILEGFIDNGLALKADARGRYKEIQNRLSELSTLFTRNLAEHKDHLELTESQLAGLPEDYIQGLSRTDDGKYIVTLSYPDYVPFMEMAKDADARRQLYMKYENRASDKNLPILEESLKLRDELAKLFGYRSYAEYALKDRMARRPKRVMDFLNRLTAALKGPAQAEEDRLLSVKREDFPEATRVERWERAYYSHIVKKRLYSIDQNEVRPYFPVDVVIRGTLDVYQDVLGLTFTEVQAPTWHDDVKLIEARDRESGDVISYFYLDLFPREGKYGHAMATFLVKGRELSGGAYRVPVAAMVANFSKPTADKPALLKHGEVETFFHEFGHLMHQTLTKARYYSYSGTNVARDFVEVPSQMLENFVWKPEVLERLSGHYLDHSRKLPKDILDKLISAKNFNMAMAQLRQISFAAVDMAYHSAVPADTDEVARQVFEQTGVGAPVPGTHFQASFAHIMSGYKAGYYGYLWARVYAQDVFSVFEQEGLFNPETGRRYRRTILERGSSVDEEQQLRDFLGRKPQEGAFYKYIDVRPTSESLSQKILKAIRSSWNRLFPEKRPSSPSRATVRTKTLLPAPSTPIPTEEEPVVPTGPETVAAETRAPPVDFSIFKSGEIYDIFWNAQNKLDNAIAEIVAIPREKRTFQNTIRALEDLRADYADLHNITVLISVAGEDSSTRNTAQGIAERFRDIFAREELYAAVQEYAEKGKPFRRLYDVLLSASRYVPGLKRLLTPLFSRFTPVGEDRLLLDQVLQDFTDSGMSLDPEKRHELLNIQNRLADLADEFMRNLTAHEDRIFLTREQLKGVPEDLISQLDFYGDEYVLPIDDSTRDAIMTMAEDPETRRLVHEKYDDRAADANVAILEETFRLRQKMADLFGQKTFADLALKNRVAKEPARVFKLLERIQRGTIVQAREEERQLLRLKQQDFPEATVLEPWDVDFYSARLKKMRFDYDPKEVRRYFPADSVIQGALGIYQELLGVTFHELPTDAWQKDVRTFDIREASTDRLIGHFYLDLFRREGKFNNMFQTLQGRELPDGRYRTPVGAIVTNFAKPADGRPALLGLNEIQSFFHEFGHLMHHALGRTRYARFSGTEVARDFVEVPSTLMEEFVWQKDVLSRLSGHVDDRGRKIPEPLLDKVLASRNFQSATWTLRRVALTTFDMLCHTAVPEDSTELYRRVMESLGLSVAPNTHWHAGFRHLVMKGYEAGYYGYLWSRVYAKDIFSRFQKDGVINPALGMLLRKKILETGGTQDEEDQLIRFLGRRPNERAFLKSMGISREKTVTSAVRDSIEKSWKKILSKKTPASADALSGDREESTVTPPPVTETGIPKREGTTAAPRSPPLDFTALTPEQMQLRFNEATERYDRAIEEIVSIPSAERNFGNTIQALETAQTEFIQAMKPLFFMADVSPDKTIREKAIELQEKGYAGLYSKGLYRAFKEAARKSVDLDPVDQRLLNHYRILFRNAGMELSRDQSLLFTSLTNRLNKISNTFQTNVKENTEFIAASEGELPGVPRNILDSLEKDGEGNLRIKLDPATYESIMTLCDNAALRRRLETAYENAAAKENRPLVEEALKIRQGIATLLGYESYAHYSLEENMARTPERVRTFLKSLQGPIKARSRSEFKELLALKRQDDPAAKTIDSWDIRYYENKLQMQKYRIDSELVRQYFPADTVIEGVLDLYQEVMDVRFVEIPAKAWQQDVRQFEIRNPAGEMIGSFYLDLYPREGKYTHFRAYTLSYGHALPDGSYRTPTAAIVCNFTRPAPGTPSLLSHNEVQAFFHEFGHLLHETLTKARYASLSGTNVVSDYVEMPSQAMENYAWSPEILRRISGHYLDKDKKLPADLAEKIVAARLSNSGIFYLRIIARALLDQIAHLGVPSDIMKTLRKVYGHLGMPINPDALNIKEARFGHMMGDYGAHYYSYLWSLVYAFDVFSVFQTEGITHPSVGEKYRRTILEPGGGVPEEDQLSHFLGRSPDERAFLQTLQISRKRTLISTVKESIQNSRTNILTKARSILSAPRTHKIRQFVRSHAAVLAIGGTVVLYPVLTYFITGHLPPLLPFNQWMSSVPGMGWFDNLFFVRWLTIFMTMSLSDLLVQKFVEKRKSIDWKRTGRYMLFAAPLGLVYHFLYGWMDATIVIPGSAIGTVAAKTAFDQLIWAPVLLSTLFLYTMFSNVRSGKGWKTAWKEMRAKFWPTLLTNWLVWTPLQLANFGLTEAGLMPAAMRLFFIGIWVLPWGIFQNWMAYTQKEAPLQFVKSWFQNRKDKLKVRVQNLKEVLSRGPPSGLSFVKQQWFKNLIFAVISTSIYALSYVLVEQFAHNLKTLNPLTLAFGREIISLTFVTVLMLTGFLKKKNYFKEFKQLNWKTLKPLLGVNLAKFALYTPLWYMAIRLTSAQGLALMGLAAPIFVGLLTWLLLKSKHLNKYLQETSPKLTWTLILGFVTVMIGVTLVIMNSGGGGAKEMALLGNIIGLATVVIQALMIIFVKKLTTQMSVLSLTFVNYVMAIPILALVSLTGVFGAIQWPMLVQVWTNPGFLMAGVGVVMGLIFYFKSMKHGSAFITTIVVDGWDPLATGVFTCLILSRLPLISEIAAFVLIFSGIMTIMRQEAAKQKKAEELLIGVDIGAANIRVGFVNGNAKDGKTFEIVDSLVETLPKNPDGTVHPQDAAMIAARLIAEGMKKLKQAGWKFSKNIGVSAPGSFMENGRVYPGSVPYIPDLEEKRLRDILLQELGDRFHIDPSHIANDGVLQGYVAASHYLKSLPMIQKGKILALLPGANFGAGIYDVKNGEAVPHPGPQQFFDVVVRHAKRDEPIIVSQEAAKSVQSARGGEPLMMTNLVTGTALELLGSHAYGQPLTAEELDRRALAGEEKAADIFEKVGEDLANFIIRVNKGWFKKHTVKYKPDTAGTDVVLIGGIWLTRGAGKDISLKTARDVLDRHGYKHIRLVRTDEIPGLENAAGQLGVIGAALMVKKDAPADGDAIRAPPSEKRFNLILRFLLWMVPLRSIQKTVQRYTLPFVLTVSLLLSPALAGLISLGYVSYHILLRFYLRLKAPPASTKMAMDLMNHLPQRQSRYQELIPPIRKISNSISNFPDVRQRAMAERYRKNVGFLSALALMYSKQDLVIRDDGLWGRTSDAKDMARFLEDTSLKLSNPERRDFMMSLRALSDISVEINQSYDAKEGTPAPDASQFARLALALGSATRTPLFENTVAAWARRDLLGIYELLSGRDAGTEQASALDELHQLGQNLETTEVPAKAPVIQLADVTADNMANLVFWEKIAGRAEATSTDAEGRPLVNPVLLITSEDADVVQRQLESLILQQAVRGTPSGPLIRLRTAWSKGYVKVLSHDELTDAGALTDGTIRVSRVLSMPQVPPFVTDHYMIRIVTRDPARWWTKDLPSNRQELVEFLLFLTKEMTFRAAPAEIERYLRTQELLQIQA